MELAPLPPVTDTDPWAPHYDPRRLTETEAVILRRSESRFAVGYGETPEVAGERAEAGLSADLVGRSDAAAGLLRGAAQRNGRRRNSLPPQVASVMKVNTLGPKGAIGRRWSTPDRIPHRHMWLWDSVFHSFAMNRVDPQLSWDFLMAMLDAQQLDGMVPHVKGVSGLTSEVTQPSLLAWGIWENYAALGDKSAAGGGVSHGWRAIWRGIWRIATGTGTGCSNGPSRPTRNRVRRVGHGQLLSVRWRGDPGRARFLGLPGA